MDSSVSPKDEIWFIRVCHHISNAVYKLGGKLRGGPQPVWNFIGKKNTHIPCPKTNIESPEVQPKGQLLNIINKLPRFLNI
jgi:hypothetical protein